MLLNGGLSARPCRRAHPRFLPTFHLQADLGDLRGLNTGLDSRNSSMINGGDFDGAKAYKDSKVGAAFSCCCLWTLLRCRACCHGSRHWVGDLYAGCP